jgi:undecaprenyl-diphosphatase
MALRHQFVLEKKPRLNPVDRYVMSFINEFARKSWAFDNLIEFISRFELLKGGVVFAIIWVLWYSEVGGKATDATRKTIIMTILGAMGAVIAVRILANFLPFHPRPVNNPELAFRLPFGVLPQDVDDWGPWSSFPSDHATLFSALSTGLFLISSQIGLLVASYSLLLILLPRIYLGFHYPTDIIAGATIGMMFILLVNSQRIKEPVAERVLRFGKAHPGLFYGISFLLTYQIATLFDDVRKFGDFSLSMIKALSRHLFS